MTQLDSIIEQLELTIGRKLNASERASAELVFKDVAMAMEKTIAREIREYCKRRGFR